MCCEKMSFVSLLPCFFFSGNWMDPTVCVSVLHIVINPTNMAEPTEVPIWLWTPVGPRVNSNRAYINPLLCITIQHISNWDSPILYGHYLPTVILTIIWYSITYSLFHSRLKTFLFCKSFPPQPFPFLLPDSLHGFPRLLFLSKPVLRFSFFCFILFSCRFPCGRLSWLMLAFQRTLK